MIADAGGELLIGGGRSTVLFEQMKKHFGIHCHLLRLRSGGRTVITDDDAVTFPTINWRSAAEELAEITSKAVSPDHANHILIIADTDLLDEESPKCLPSSDVTGIRTMIRDMTQMSVVPFMERCIATWNDQVASRRKGLSGRFLSMSKRYFSTTTSRTSSSSSNYDPHTGSYDPTTPEAQMRKLADFAFMLRDWKLAYSIYDLLRTDFNNDKAWKYHAAAQEFTVITHILSGSPVSHKVRAELIEPTLDLACYSYISRCSAHYSALRCLLVSSELLRLRGAGAIDEAAKWAIRAREISVLGPVGHALITERVGDCYRARTTSQPLGNRTRKAAMWKILAAAEWMEAGKTSQARRCLDAALPVYEHSNFAHMAEFVEGLKERAGYAEGGVEGGEVEEAEEIEMGEGKAKRKSVIAPAPAREVDEEAEGVEEGFVES